MKTIESVYYADVICAMDEAEEIGGPDGEEYDELMRAISVEALARIERRKASDLVTGYVVTVPGVELNGREEAFATHALASGALDGMMCASDDYRPGRWEIRTVKVPAGTLRHSVYPEGVL